LIVRQDDEGVVVLTIHGVVFILAFDVSVLAEWAGFGFLAIFKLETIVL